MAPYSSTQSAHHDNDVGCRSFQIRNDNNHLVTNLGFTKPLIESISTFKAKFESWEKREKSKADSRAESYHNNLMKEQAIIDSQVMELTNVQRERGMGIDKTDGVLVEGKEGNGKI